MVGLRVKDNESRVNRHLETIFDEGRSICMSTQSIGALVEMYFDFFFVRQAVQCTQSRKAATNCSNNLVRHFALVDGVRRY